MTIELWGQTKEGPMKKADFTFTVPEFVETERNDHKGKLKALSPVDFRL